MEVLPMGILDNKVAIVTGAGQGVGKGVARALAKEGAAIVVLDLDGEKAASTAREIAQLGAKSLDVTCDIRDREQVNRAVENIVSTFGTVDILVNVAQAWGRFVPLQEKTSDEMVLGFESGPLGTWHLMVACYPVLKDKNGYNGKIINFGSGAGFNNMPFHGEYSAAKEAIRALSRTAAVEWGKNRINTNVICPAALTPGMEAWKRDAPSEFEAMVARFPLRRIGDPEKDIGRVAVFLSGPDSDYITGCTIMVDGGNDMLH
jgi:NAD(P)-dependent dehydrogenase (short-subunit alcohol dehydrogenase family)